MSLFFYLFASLITLSSLAVVVSKNPVYSVLWLIFAFCNGSGLMILLGAEFLSMMLIVIYVGAVAVLFLFVVMMLDINLTEFRSHLRSNIFLPIMVSFVMLADLVLIILLSTKTINLHQSNQYIIPSNVTNTHSIGSVLYTDFILPFQTAGLILFVAMVACIAITLRHRIGVRRQNISQQLGKNKENSLLLTKPNLNSGIDGIDYE